MSPLRTSHVNTQYYALTAGGSFDKDAIPLAVLTEEEGTKKMAQQGDRADDKHKNKINRSLILESLYH